MCRLYAQLDPAPHDLQEPLLLATNAVREQSHRHPHGWGLSWYSAGAVELRHGLLPAHADPGFARAAREERTGFSLSHVRDASVGPVSEPNTHPFVHERWSFAHNGTVARFRESARVRAAIEAELHPALRAALRGDTDSERCFMLFLTLLQAAVPAGAQPGMEDLRSALARTTELLIELADAGAEKPSSFNFIVTDGQLLAASRRNRPLHLSTGARGALALSSERIGEGPWREVPQGGFVAADLQGELYQGELMPVRRRSAA